MVELLAIVVVLSVICGVFVRGFLTPDPGARIHAEELLWGSIALLVTLIWLLNGITSGFAIAQRLSVEAQLTRAKYVVIFLLYPLGILSSLAALPITL